MRIKLIIFVVVLVAVAIGSYFFGRVLWKPLQVKVFGKRTVAEVVVKYGDKSRARLEGYFSKAGVEYPPKSLTFLAIKDTGLLEVWANNDGAPNLIHTYPIKAQSGNSGPKLREGDHQVPEGVYRIDGLNPNSSYHLSMKLNYPNAFDLKHAKVEGRDSPGSNIFIHGKAVSVGCLAMGDRAIEDLFVLVADVGRENTSVVIAPSDPRIRQLDRLTTIPWSDELYATIEQEFGRYVENNQLN